jgi:hypothetical protein
MTYRWLSDLDLALAAGGVPFTPVGYSPVDPTGAADWRTRGRPASTGQFDVAGVLCHHTASPAGLSDAADLNVVLAGNAEAPGPISQLYLGRTGVLYLVAAGRANHGGGGIRPGVDSSCTDMNARLIGIEAGNNGVGEQWGADQCAIYAATVAALCEWYGWTTDDVYLHATTGPPSGGCNSKIDPAGPWTQQPDLTSQTWDLDVWRAYVAAAAQPVPPTDGDEMTAADWETMQALIHETMLGIVRSPEYAAIVDAAARTPSDAAALNPADHDAVQTRCFDAVLGVVRSEEYGNIIRSNTA